MVKRKLIQDVSREIPRHPDPVYIFPPKPIAIPIKEIPRNVLDFNPEINKGFKENLPF